MSGLAPAVFHHYFDDNGDPLTGGKVYFFAANTGYATPKNTYTDYALTTAHAHPIVLDADGRPPSPIYLESGIYDVRIDDANDVALDTVDDVFAAGTNPTGTSFAVVDTYDELTALAAGQYNLVYARGNASANDGGGRFFNWDSASSAADNGETILEPDSTPATGRWIAARWDNLLGGDNAASTEIGADIDVDTGANLKLYAAGHATKAGDVELRDGTTGVLTYDKSGSTLETGKNLGVNTTPGFDFEIGGLSGNDFKIEHTGLGNFEMGTISGDLVIVAGDITLQPNDTNGTVITTRPLRLKSYTVSGVPTGSAGDMIFVTDETGGAIPAFSDGTNWRRVTDRAIIS